MQPFTPRVKTISFVTLHDTYADFERAWRRPPYAGLPEGARIIGENLESKILRNLAGCPYQITQTITFEDH